MLAKFRTTYSREEARQGFLDALARSRFTATLVDERHGRWFVLNIYDVRLRQKKDYCGNHAGPCLVREKRHFETRYLEGADWVAFNDMLNDVLDRLEAAADVASGHCTVRRGRRRRVHYGANGQIWDRYGYEGDYEDWCGRKAARSTYPDSTPGIPEWRLRKRRAVSV